MRADVACERVGCGELLLTEGTRVRLLAGVAADMLLQVAALRRLVLAVWALLHSHGPRGAGHASAVLVFEITELLMRSWVLLGGLVGDQLELMYEVLHTIKRCKTCLNDVHCIFNCVASRTNSMQYIVLGHGVSAKPTLKIHDEPPANHRPDLCGR